MKIKLNKKRLFILLLISWFLINLLQAIYTEINADEAYYFFYSKHLDWGYYDHPPMVAWMVFISSCFFSGNLGVRFITVLLQIPTLILIWLQLDKKETDDNRSVLFYFMICASLVMSDIYGFITTPDAPLLFFTALLFYAYKQFLNRVSWSYTLLMSIAIGGLIYSKYQGALVVGFIIMSNARLLLNFKFQVALILALVLYIPYLHWQYIHDFPSLRYQLIDRSQPFKWRYCLEYVPNQLIAFNPFTLAAVLYVLFKYKPPQKFERAQYFVIGGFILFFWISSFRGHVELQWTVSASIPIIILLNNRIAIDGRLRNYVKIFIGGSLFLILIARILIVTSLLPAKSGVWGKESQYLAIEKLAKNEPVVFTESYEGASLYTFFTGKPATAISSLRTRLTQFDICRPEQDWHNKPVFIYGKYKGRSKAYKIDNQVVEGFFADSLQTTNYLKIEYETAKDSLRIGDSLSLHFTVENPAAADINFESPDFPIKVQLILIGSTGLFEINGTTRREITSLKPNEKISDEIKFAIPVISTGSYKMELSCSTIFGPALNSNFKKIILY